MNADPFSDELRRTRWLLQNRQREEALLILQAILESQPDHLAALDLLGFAQFFSGRVAEAKETCERTLRVKPDHAYAHAGLGVCLAKLGLIDDGVAHLKDAIRLSPGFVDAYRDLANVLKNAGRTAEAEAVLSQLQRK